MAIALVIALSGSTESGAAFDSLPLTTAPVLLRGGDAREISDHGGSPQRVTRPRCASAKRAVAFFRTRAAYWNERRSVPIHVGRKPHGCRDARYLARLWAERASLARTAYRAWFERTYEKWRCIHEHEGAWNANTGNGYWGGLQMDWGFMHTYGPEFIRRYGLAHLWPVWAQLEAAERAFYGFAGFGGRGYSPWGTRGACGV